MVPTGIPSWKGWLSMLLMPWGPPVNGEVQLQCRSTGERTMCLRKRVPSSAIPFSVGLVPRCLERAWALAASNPPMAEGGNHRVSKSWRNRALPGCWGLGDPRDLSHSSWRCPDGDRTPSSDCQPNWPNVQHLASAWQISSQFSQTTVEGKLQRRLRVTLNRDQHGGVGRGTSKSLCCVPAQKPPCVLGLSSSTCGAVRQQDPSRLEVLHCWNPLQERAVFLCLLLEDTNSGWPTDVPRTTTPRRSVERSRLPLQLFELPPLELQHPRHVLRCPFLPY